MSVEKILQTTMQLADKGVFRSKRKLPADYMEELSTLSDEEAMELAARLFMMDEWRYIWSAVVTLKNHPTARKALTWKYLEPLGNRMDSWGLVDAFTAIAGPAWREGLLSDTRVMSWTRSKSRWWRRAALVCTVFLNRKAQGGTGDTPRTLMVCETLVSDRDDMVVKGMSWALRDLLKRDRQAVERFLEAHENELAALVKREVRCKLTTGRKNPPRKKQ